MRSFARGVPFTLFLLAACCPWPPLAAPPSPQLVAAQALEAHLAQLVGQVRGIELKSLPPLTIPDASEPGAGAGATGGPEASQNEPSETSSALAALFPDTLAQAFHALPADLTIGEADALVSGDQAVAHYEIGSGAISLDRQVSFADAASLSVAMQRRHDAVAAGSAELDQLGLGLSARMLLHELVHAAQNQRYDIKAVLSHGQDPDEALALLMLLEGDATFTTWDVAHSALGITLLDIPGVHKTLRNLGVEELFGAAAERIPPAVRELFLTPYYDGAGFAAAIVRSGGYTLFDQVYANPPSATAQLLHPERYFAGEQALIVTLPDIDAASWGLRTVEEGTLGEARFKAILAAWGAQQCATEVAGLWRGDRYAILGAQNAAGDGTSDAAAEPATSPARSLRESMTAVLILQTAPDGTWEGLLRCLESAQNLPEPLVWRQDADRIALAVGLAPERYQVEQLLLMLLTELHVSQQPSRSPLAVPFAPEPEAGQYAQRFAVDTGGAQGTVVDGWFQHPGLRLRVPLPRGWETVAPGAQKNLIPLVLRNTAAHAMLTFIVVRNDRNAALLAVAGETMAALSGRFPQMNIEAEATAPTGCGQAYTAVFSYQEDSNDSRGFITIMLGEGTVVTVLMTAAADGFAPARETTQALLDQMSCSQAATVPPK
jgi:hypothetical protein